MLIKSNKYFPAIHCIVFVINIYLSLGTKASFSLKSHYTFVAMTKIIECPRDAMQGISAFIPTEKKVEYLNLLLDIGFDTIDFGSFVSPKAIPQMKDTGEIVAQLKLHNTNTKLLAIVANLRGAQDAASFDSISYLGFPFSISPTFQMRNTNSNIEQSFERVKAIQELCVKHGKTLVIYISMGFGNPYGDPWHPDIVNEWIDKLKKLEIKIISLADTVGMATAETVAGLFQQVMPEFPEIEIGAHLHATPDNWYEKLNAAYSAGCKRIDGAIKGFGGCPMAEDKLTGNMATENILQFLGEKGEQPKLDMEKFGKASYMAMQLMG
jgi:hydroxymethylglutaryl-CoA lyase